LKFRTTSASLRETDPSVAAFDFRGHDLRRTAATRIADAGISQADIAKVLNHVEGGPRATMVYNRYAYDREKRVALETWDRCLRVILVERKNEAANVVPFASVSS
jgi:integrase